MNSVNIDNENFSGEIPQRAVSLYGQNEGVDDFPVLKAFQQYIDAEQEKARKRIFGLGIFFGAILVVVIAVFLFLLHGINIRNQTLSDRLVEYAMKEADRRQMSVGQTQGAAYQNDAMLKAMTETLVTLQGKLDSNGSKSSGIGNGKSDREDADQIRKEKSLLDAEKRRLAAERERLRNIEIEQQRRRLYPEFYSNENYGRRKTKNNKGDYLLTDEDIREIIREADAVADAANDRHAVSRSKDVEASDAETEKTVSTEDSEGAIEYFNDDNYTIPVDVKSKGSSSKVNFIVPYE